MKNIIILNSYSMDLFMSHVYIPWPPCPALVSLFPKHTICRRAIYIEALVSSSLEPRLEDNAITQDGGLIYNEAGVLPRVLIVDICSMVFVVVYLSPWQRLLLHGALSWLCVSD